MSARRLPALQSVWVAAGEYDPDRRLKILGYLPPGDHRPVGVRARVLTSTSPTREVLMAMRDLRENYTPGA